MPRRFFRVPSRWWGKVVGAGILGGMAMGLYEMAAASALGMGFWAPMNMIGATLPAFRPPVEGFQVGPTTTGMVLHLITSAFWAIAFAALAFTSFPRVFSSYGLAAIAGLAWGLTVYFVMGLGIGPLLDPALRMAPPLHYFLGHLVYGVVTVLAIARFTSRREYAISFAPEVPVAERETTTRR